MTLRFFAEGKQKIVVLNPPPPPCFATPENKEDLLLEIALIEVGHTHPLACGCQRVHTVLDPVWLYSTFALK